MSHDQLHPVEAEDLVIGQVLYAPDCISRAAAILKPDHFFGEIHRIVFEAALDMWREAMPVDLVTMTHVLNKRGVLAKVGGTFQLVGWTRRVAQTIHLETHCGIVREQYGLRVIKDSARRLENVTMADDPDEVIALHGADLARASSADIGTDKNAGDLAYSMMNATNKPKALKLGMSGIDDLVSVLDDNMVVFTAPSGIGKTAAAMSAIMNILPERKPWVVSLEMSAEELMTRVLCGFAGVEISAAISNTLLEVDVDKMAKAANDHADLLARLDICDDEHMTIDQFRARADHKVKNEGVGIIAIDYGQLMGADPSQYKNTTEKHEIVSRGIKATTKALKVPIILIVQLNKDGDIYGSGQYEKDAHVVVRFYSPDGSSAMPYQVMKNRNGRTGKGTTPCDLAHGLVGRMFDGFTGPLKPHPDNRTTPKNDDDVMPF